jgi:hypothetical protein
MSKSLSGSGSVDLTVNSLSFNSITATNLTASSTTTTTDLTVNNDAGISGNLSLGNLTDVEQAIQDAGNDAGVGLTKDTSVSPSVLNFTGGDIGSVDITTTGDIISTNITSLTNSVNTNTNSINTNTSNISSLTTSVNNKQDDIPLITTNNASNLTLSRSDNLTSVLTVDGRINLTQPSSQFLTVIPLFNCDVPADFSSGVTSNDIIVKGDTTSSNIEIEDDNDTTPVSHSYKIRHDANQNNGLDLELDANGDINLINLNDKDITLKTGLSSSIKHLVCDASTFQTQLYFNDSLKLNTTNTGINITGESKSAGIINNSSYTQVGTDANTFFGDSTFVGALQYADTAGNPSVLKNVKTEIDSKQDLIDSNNRLNANLIGDNGNISNSEFNFLDGVSSNLQNQLDGKQNTINDTTNLLANRIQLNKLVVDSQISVAESENGLLNVRTSGTSTGIAYHFKAEGLHFTNNTPLTFPGTLEKRRLTFNNTRNSDSYPQVLFKGFSQLGTGSSRTSNLFIGNFTRLSTGFQCENQSYNGNKFEFLHPPMGSSTNDLFKIQGFNTTGSLAPNNDRSAEMKFSYQGNLTINGTFTQNSDERIKENIVDANTSNLIEDFKKIRFVNYNLINDKEKIKKLGCIAQEIEEIYPNCVVESPNYVDDEEEILDENIPYIKQIKYEPIYAKGLMINQYLLNKIDELEQRLSVLENNNIN